MRGIGLTGRSSVGLVHHLQTVPCRSKAVFSGLEEEDIGIYSCFVTHTDGASSSFTLSEEGGWQP